MHRYSYLHIITYLNGYWAQTLNIYRHYDCLCSRLEVKYFEKYLNTNTNTLKVSNIKFKYKYLCQGCISNPKYLNI